MIKILDKYILKELLGPFLFGIGIFTIILAVGTIFDLVRLIVEYNVPFFTASKLFLFGLPHLISFTPPMAILLSTLLSLSRLSSDNEIMALKAAGVNFYSLVFPILFFSFFIALLSIIFAEEVSPRADNYYGKVMWNEVDKRGIKIDIFICEKNFFLYAKKFIHSEYKMEGVVFEEFYQGKHIRTISAKEAFWKKKKIYFKYGRLHNFDLSGNLKNILHFKEYKMNFQKTPQDMARFEKKPEQMSVKELKRKIDFLKREGSDIKKFMVELNLKFAFPFSCFIFALLGIGFGVRAHRSSSSIGVGLSLIIIFSYYVLLTISNAWGKTGFISPFLSAWIPNIVFGIVGIGLLKRVAK